MATWLQRTLIVAAATATAFGALTGTAGAQIGSQTFESHDEFTAATRNMYDAFSTGNKDAAVAQICEARKDDLARATGPQLAENTRVNTPLRLIVTQPVAFNGADASANQFLIFDAWSTTISTHYRYENGGWRFCGYDHLGPVGFGANGS